MTSLLEIGFLHDFTKLGTADSPREIPKSWHAPFRSLGHKLERFWSTRATVRRRIHRDDAFAALRTWIGADGGTSSDLRGDGTFAVAVITTPAGWTVAAPFLPPDVLAHLMAVWRAVEPEAPKILPPALEAPAEVHAPRWLALLRLRPLRPTWESVLRRDHFDSLLEVMPDAWLLDPAPLPPGAVVPRLEVPSWKVLAERHASPGTASSATLAVVKAESWDGPAADPEDAASRDFSRELTAALDVFQTDPHVLVKLPQATAEVIISFYEKRGARVDHRGLLAMTRADSGHWRPCRVRH